MQKFFMEMEGEEIKYQGIAIGKINKKKLHLILKDNLEILRGEDLFATLNVAKNFFSDEYYSNISDLEYITIATFLPLEKFFSLCYQKGKILPDKVIIFFPVLPVGEIWPKLMPTYIGEERRKGK